MNWYAHVPLELVNPNNDVNRFAPDVWSKLSKRFFFRMRPLSGPFVREMIFFFRFGCLYCSPKFKLMINLSIDKYRPILVSKSYNHFFFMSIGFNQVCRHVYFRSSRCALHIIVLAAACFLKG